MLEELCYYVSQGNYTRNEWMYERININVYIFLGATFYVLHHAVIFENGFFPHNGKYYENV